MSLGSENEGALEKWAVVLVFGIVVVLFLLRLAGDGIMELGDGVNHYFMARYAWVHPDKLIDLWGKPLFTLLASPFAQIGYIGVAVFNLLVVALTGVLSIRLLRGVGGYVQLMVPFLLLLSDQYLYTTMAGMTEPLFGLLTLGTLILLIKEEPYAAAMIASFSPLARPEYVAFMPMVAFWLLWDRKWIALPWLLLGSVLYGCVTWVVYGNPLWFWTADPYDQAGGVYGSGTLDHFVSRAEEIFGLPLFVALCIAFIVWPATMYLDRMERRAHKRMFLVAGLTLLGVLAIHSVLWWKGWRGSAGLLRVLATATPLGVVFAMYTIGRSVRLVTVRWPRVRGWVAIPITVSAWCVVDAIQKSDLPYHVSDEQEVLQEASDLVLDQVGEDAFLYSTHPYLAFGTGRDPYAKENYDQLWGVPSPVWDDLFKDGDMLLWDAQLGPSEGGISMEALLADERFEVVRLFAPRHGWVSWNNEVYELLLLARRNTKRWTETDTFSLQHGPMNSYSFRADTLDCGQKVGRQWCLQDGEFPFEIIDLPATPHERIFDEWTFSCDLEIPENSEVSIVLKQEVDGRLERYDQVTLTSGQVNFTRKIPYSDTNARPRIYLWNISRTPFVMKRPLLVRKKWYQTGT